MTKTGYLISSGVGGVIVGAIGGAIAANSRDYPVLKASLGTGAIYIGLAALLVATDSLRFDPPGTLSGPPQPLRFP